MAVERGLGISGFFGGERVVLVKDFPPDENPYQLPEIPAGTSGIFVRERRYALLGRVNVVKVTTILFDGWLLLPDDMLSSTER